MADHNYKALHSCHNLRKQSLFIFSFKDEKTEAPRSQKLAKKVK
jgi:hypothetical protein